MRLKRKTNPQLALNQYVIKWFNNGKWAFRDVVLKAVLARFGCKNSTEQLEMIRNSRFFQPEAVKVADYGRVWLFLDRKIVADLVINTKDGEVLTVAETVQ